MYMLKQLLPAFRLLLLLTILLGGLYPLAVTVIAQAVFPAQANGSVLLKDGSAIGSSFIAQNFDDPRYFSARPSAIGYNPVPSGGSNLGPTSQTLKDQIAQRDAMFRAFNKLPPEVVIPAEMRTASASGLDPHISLTAAQLQIPRIATARNLPAEQIAALVARYTESPQFGFLGKMRVNVLLLNLALDGVQ